MNIIAVGLLVDHWLGVGNRQVTFYCAFASLLGTYAHVTADLPVDEFERVCHGVTDVGQTEEEQRYSDDGVKDCDYFAPRSLWGNVAVPCGVKKKTLYKKTAIQNTLQKIRI